MRSQSVFCSCCRATFYRRRFQIFGRIRRVANLQQTRHREYTAFHDARSTTTNLIPDISTLAVSIHQRRLNPSAFFIIVSFSAACILFVIGSLSSSCKTIIRRRDGVSVIFARRDTAAKTFLLVDLLTDNAFGTVRWFLLRPTAVHSVTLGPTIMGHYSFIY